MFPLQNMNEEFEIIDNVNNSPVSRKVSSPNSNSVENLHHVTKFCCQDKIDCDLSKKMKDLSNSLREQRQQVYGISTFVEDLFVDIGSRFKVLDSEYQSQIEELTQEIHELRSRLEIVEKKGNGKTLDADGDNYFLEGMDDMDTAGRSDNIEKLIDLDYRTITIKTIRDQSFTVSVGTKSCLQDVKIVIEEVLKLPRKSQILVGNGRVVDDDETVFENVLYLIVNNK
eukprot:NODE_96_length_20709_cov_1.429161.p10 type:complete len:227 gc:universal NODE_96_length_20709_cov_1.429161:9619-8939(-)